MAWNIAWLSKKKRISCGSVGCMQQVGALQFHEPVFIPKCNVTFMRQAQACEKQPLVNRYQAAISATEDLLYCLGTYQRLEEAYAVHQIRRRSDRRLRSE